jgi:excisionase family DNA binding protein
MEITFDQLPQAVTQLHEKLDNIERLLLEKSTESHNEPDKWFDLTELCDYLPDKPTKPTVYGWVHSGIIPAHKGQKKLRFLKSEIDNWLKSGRKKTLAESSSEADQYILRRKGLGHGKC